MLFDPLIVANNFIVLSKDEHIEVTPMKLQKLLYFLYRDYYQAYKSPLFAERFEVWKYGPVLSEVYNAFSKYRAEPITDFCASKAGKSLMVNLEKCPEFRDSLLRVWNRYKNYNGIELSQITHKEGSAWYKAWQRDGYFLTDEDIEADHTGL